MKKKPRVETNWKRILSIIIATVIGLAAYMYPLGLEQPAQAVMAIMLFAGVLWFTEALPLWVTALAVPPLLVVGAGIKPAEAYYPFFDPIIALLLGGFVLALGIQKTRLDRRIAGIFIRAFGTKPKRYLLGLMFATAFMSFWISNTASTLLMIPIGVAAVTASGLKPMKSEYCKTVMLGIGYSATIGGVGTLVGTPPNLIAVRFLAESGIMVNFLDWMVHAVPLVIIMVLVAWGVLSLQHKAEAEEIKPPRIDGRKLDRSQKITIAVFALTAILWVTEGIHGVHNSVIAMIPIVGLYSLGVLRSEDLKNVKWSVLILVGGGLTLGSAIHSTGLDMFIASGLSGILAGQPQFTMFLVISLFAIAFTAFVANTAGAAILVPIGIPMATMLGIDPMLMAVLIGIVVSFDFIVPVGTPPNAIAYGTGYITVKDMVKSGLLISIIGAIVTACFGTFIWPLL
jgi:sodium-dependent dicarboxylate transporter 2/3/5